MENNDDNKSVLDTIATNADLSNNCAKVHKKNIDNNLHGLKLYKKSIICISLSAFFILASLIFSWVISNKKMGNYRQVGNSNVIYGIEKIIKNDNSLSITGWTLLLNNSCDNQRVVVFLRNVDNEKDIHYACAKSQSRPDISNYFQCEYDYSNCGFYVQFKNNHIRFDDMCYEILIKIALTNEGEEDKFLKERSITEVTISTNLYLTDGNISVCKSNEFDKINKTGTFLDEIVDKGRLLSYRRENGVYIYEYDNRLYWVATPNFMFEEDKKTYIDYVLMTSRIDKLPQYCKDNNWTHDELGFVFEDYEIIDECMAPYRMTSRAIPTDYPITFLWTGQYQNNTWAWIEYIHLLHTY